MFSRRFQDMFARRLLRDVFKTSSRRLQDVFKKTSCNYVFRTFWKKKNCYTKDVFKTPSKRLQYVFTNTNVCWENIIDTDYAHGKRVCEDFKIKTLGEYHDLYVQSNTFLLADMFENFRNKCLKIYDSLILLVFLLHQV